MGRSQGEPRVIEFDAKTDRQQTYYLMIIVVVRMIIIKIKDKDYHARKAL